MEFLEQIQKDRKIAQDLVNNKIAGDIGEAFKMIQEKRHMQVKIVPVSEQNIDGSLKINQHAQTQTQTQQTQAQQTQSIQQTAQPTSESIERLAKIEEFLHKFDKFFSKYHDDTNAKLSDLTKNLNALNNELQELKNRKVEPVVHAKSNITSHSSSAEEIIARRQMLGLQESNIEIEDTHAEKQQTQQAPQAKPQQAASSTFRQKDGNYKSDDVSVEKIFNNSHNRLMKR